MSLISGIIGESISKPIESMGNVASKFVVTEKDRMNYDQIMSEMQTKIDSIEAQNNSFLGSWRGGLGWVCVLCIAAYYLPQFAIADYVWLRDCLGQGHMIPYPIDADSIFHLVCLLLGFGAYRSFEKVLKVK